MTISIREATVYDMKTILEIENACFTDDLRFDENLFYLFLFKKRGELFLVAEEKLSKNRSIIVGFVIAYLNKEMNFEIITLNVHPDSQNQGIGTKLLLTLENQIKERISQSKLLKEITLELMVYEKNYPALSLYKKLGYKEHERIPNYYQNSKGGIRMLKTLAVQD